MLFWTVGGFARTYPPPFFLFLFPVNDFFVLVGFLLPYSFTGLHQMGGMWGDFVGEFPTLAWLVPQLEGGVHCIPFKTSTTRFWRFHPRFNDSFFQHLGMIWIDPGPFGWMQIICWFSWLFVILNGKLKSVQYTEYFSFPEVNMCMWNHKGLENF